MSIPSNFNPLGLNNAANYPPGMMILYGNNRKHIECFNLNERASCQYLFEKCKNITFPEGIDFASCTTGKYMFSNAKNIEFKNAKLFENITSADSMFANAEIVGDCLDEVTFSKVTSGVNMFAGTKIDHLPLNATFEKITSIGNFFNNVYTSSLSLPNATFNSLTSNFGNMFWSVNGSVQSKKVNFQNASFKSLTSGGTSWAGSNFIIKMPLCTFESLQTAYNKKSYPQFYIFPMLHLNLKSLTDGTGMFHGDGMDVETLETIALGPVDIRDETTGIKRYTDGSVHTITLGIDASLQSEYENPDSEIGARIRAALSEIGSRGWTVDLEWNVPTTWE